MRVFQPSRASPTGLSFCTQPSQAAVLFNSNLSRCPFLGQVVDLNVLLCTGFNSEHADLLLCPIFTQRSMNDRQIEQSNGQNFDQQQVLTNCREILIPYEKKWLVTAWNLQIIKTLLTLELSQYFKSGNTFSANKPAAASTHCLRFRNVLCLC